MKPIYDCYIVKCSGGNEKKKDLYIEVYAKSSNHAVRLAASKVKPKSYDGFLAFNLSKISPEMKWNKLIK